MAQTDSDFKAEQKAERTAAVERLFDALVDDVVRHRRDHCYKVTDLADFTCIHRTNLHLFEKKKLNPSVRKLLNICDAMGLDVVIRPRSGRDGAV